MNNGTNTTVTPDATGNIGINIASGSPQLTKLSVYGKNLTHLDVSAANHLTELYCHDNQLSTLDVSNKPALTTLRCEENQLTHLDVSNTPALSLLHCQQNQLSILNVTESDALTELYCHYNQLSQLDLSNNTGLVNLICRYNNLQLLDVSNSTELESLVCFSNQLTQLDVTNSPMLTTLHCNDNQLTLLDIANNTALIDIMCSNNYLTHLDASNNTALVALSCHDNRLSSLTLSNNLPYLYAGNQAVEVLVADVEPTFGNPLYYHNKTSVENVQIGGTAYAHGANVPKPTGGNTLNFTTNNTISAGSTPYGGVLTLINGIQVKFHSNGGTAIEPIILLPGSIIGEVYCELAGLALEGWYTEASFINAWDLETEPVQESMSLYAKWILKTGIHGATIASTVKVYPNPASNTLYIMSSETVEQVSIYDISGRMLQQTTHAVMSSAVETSLTIDVSNLANGIYLVKVKTSQGEAVKRVVISD